MSSIKHNLLYLGKEILGVLIGCCSFLLFKELVPISVISIGFISFLIGFGSIALLQKKDIAFFLAVISPLIIFVLIVEITYRISLISEWWPLALIFLIILWGYLADLMNLPK